MPNDPQVPWTDEQLARVNQVIQEEATRARVAATFLPLYGPLPPDTDFVRKNEISYREPQNVLMDARNEFAAAYAALANAMAAGRPDVDAALSAEQRLTSAQSILLGPQHIRIDDKDTIKLATLQVKVPVRNAQMADPEMTSVLALFRRAANVLARLEDAVVFRGLGEYPTLPHLRPKGGLVGLPAVWDIHKGQSLDGLWVPNPRSITISPDPPRSERLVSAVSDAIGRLEHSGHFGPFALVLGDDLFVVAQTPDPGSLVLPQDRIIPFLGGGSLLRSSTLPQNHGVMVALGGTPIELVVAKDMSLAFLQVTDEPRFLFRVYEKMVLRVREREAIINLYMPPPNWVVPRA